MTRYKVQKIMMLVLLLTAPLYLCLSSLHAEDLPPHSEALKSFRPSIEPAPDSGKKREAMGEYYLTMAVEKIRSREYDEALEALEEGDGYIADKRALAYYRGVAYFFLESYFEAESELMNIAYEGDGDFEALSLLGRIYYDRGDMYLAVESWSSALGLRPGDHELAGMLARARRDALVEEDMDTAYSGRFLLHYDGERDEERGREVLGMLEEAYSDVGEDLNYYPEGDISVIIYTRKEFDKVTALPDWAGAVYDGKIRVPVGGAELSPDRLKALLYHEYTHAVIQSMTKGACPKWLGEGLAVYEESRFVPFTGHGVAGPEKGREIASFDELDRLFNSSDAKEAMVAYDRSYRIVTRLVDDCGMYGLADMLTDLPPQASSPDILNRAGRLCGVELGMMPGGR